MDWAQGAPCVTPEFSKCAVIVSQLLRGCSDMIRDLAQRRRRRDVCFEDGKWALCEFAIGHSHRTNHKEHDSTRTPSEPTNRRRMARDRSFQPFSGTGCWLSMEARPSPDGISGDHGWTRPLHAEAVFPVMVRGQSTGNWACRACRLCRPCCWSYRA